ncbi:MAG: hypothetical protein FWD49_00040 [Firmicutes bacterium]|nr:hypothetical protein [Bacillota bacterium]
MTLNRLNEITKNYFLKNLDCGRARIFLYEPHLPFNPLPKTHAKINPNYLAYPRLTRIAKEVSHALSDLSPVRFKGDLKKAFYDAGLGLRLNNNLLMIPPYGTRVSIEILDILGNYEEKLIDLSQEKQYCKKCNLCKKNCPVGALDNGFNAIICLRAEMNNYKESTAPFEKLNGNILGCEACQLHCPHNLHLKTEDIPKDLAEILYLPTLLNYCKNPENYPLVAEKLDFYIGKNMNNPEKIQFFVELAMKNA